MKKLKYIISLLFIVLAFAGCKPEVITVAGMQQAEGEEAEYIEIQEFELVADRPKAKEAGVPGYCAVLIPVGYHESEDIPGMYVHEIAPLDSSTIYYTVSEGGEVSSALTKESYQKTMEKELKAAGWNVKVEVESFEEIDMEEIPGYKIRTRYKAQEGVMEQLTYLILAQNTYTVTYSQMEGDELLADFEIADGQIRLVREESAG